MPTYEYRCDECGVEFDLTQKMSDSPISVCPECGGSVRRLISAGGGLLFKGTGFYATDYRSGPPPAAAESSGSEKKPKEPPAKSTTKKSTGGTGDE